MLRYLARRVVFMVAMLFALSVVVFVIIQLPPGDFVTSMMARRLGSMDSLTMGEIEVMRSYYGLNDNVFVQYFTWMGRILTEGDLGTSFQYNRSVNTLIGERIGMTLVVAFSTLLVTCVLAFPIGVYAAVRQYSIGDYVATTFGFLGLATPNFLIALILMVVGLRFFGYVPAGLCSPEWCDSAWNLGKLIDLLKHLWVPMVVIGTAGTAAWIRVIRANLLDELRKPYVVAARARGVPERRLLIRYPLRVAVNPFVSTAGWAMYVYIAGDIIVGQLLGLPTLGPLMLEALRSQDMYLAGGIIMVLSVILVLMTLLSDLALAWLDPKIRLGYR